MNSRMEQLFIRIGLIDNVSGPANHVTRSIDRINNHAQGGLNKAFEGGFGLMQTGNVLNGLLEPVKKMDAALGEVASLGVASDDLQKLERSALMTSIQYGGSAADIVSASYDIQSAIAGLTGDELSTFTRTSAILAKGTKSDTGVITDYMGTMYGIFQNTAQKMGKSQWVEVLAGQTASAVQMYKTQGSEMAAAFSNLGAEGQSQGVGMAEQMAILGTLQSTMSGSEAGTKYKSFLNGIGKAQKSLGLTFVDTRGKILPMVDILTRLEGKFGQIDTVEKSDALKKAFGTKEAVGLVKLLMQNTNKLADDINELGNVSGMGRAVDMANEMVDPWERLHAVSVAIKTVLGRAMMPVLIPLIDKLIVAGETITRWSDMFPNVTRLVGIATLGIIAMVAAVSAFTLIGGIAQLSMAGFLIVMKVFTPVIWLYGKATLIAAASMRILRAAALASAIGFALLTGSMGASTGATWLFSAALWANPITWVIAGVIALGAALVLLAMNWDTITAAVDRFAGGAIRGFIQTWQNVRAVVEDNTFLRFAFTPLLAAVDIVGVVIDAFKKIPDWWKNFKSWLGNLNPFGGISSSIGALFSGVSKMAGNDVDMGVNLNAVSEKAGTEVGANDVISHHIDRLPNYDYSSYDKIPNIEHGSHDTIPSIEHRSHDTINDKVRDELQSMRVSSPSLSAPKVSFTPFLQTQQNTTQNENSTKIEKVEINTTQKIDAYLLADELAMAAG